MDTGTAAPVTWLCAGAGFSHGRLLVDELYEAIISATPLASHPSGELWLYDGGVYRYAGRLLAHLVTTRQRGRFKPEHLRALVAYAEAELTNLGSDRATPPAEYVPLVNGATGWSTRSGELAAHDRKYLSVAQWPVAYDAAATCPTFDRWLAVVLPSSAPDRPPGGPRHAARPARLPQEGRCSPIWPTRWGESTLARMRGASSAHRTARPRSWTTWPATASGGDVVREGAQRGVGHLHRSHRHGHAQAVARSGLTDRRAQVRTRVQPQFHGLMLMTMNAVPRSAIRPAPTSSAFVGTASQRHWSAVRTRRSMGLLSQRRPELARYGTVPSW